MKTITITRESTWDNDTYDENGLLDGGTETVRTIETWEWNDELGRFELVYLEEKESGEYIPFNEEEYIRDGCVEIPQNYHKAYNNLDDMIIDINILREKIKMDVIFNLYQDRQYIRGEIKNSNAEPICGYAHNGKYYINRELISAAI